MHVRAPAPRANRRFGLAHVMIAASAGLSTCAVCFVVRAGGPLDAGLPDASIDRSDSGAGTDAGAPRAPSVTCPELAGILATYPGDGATNVPRNTVVRVRYGPAALMTGLELLTVRDSEGSLVGGVVTSDVREIVFAPSAPLSPGLYTAAAPALDGASSSAFAFTVIDAFDEEPPTIGASEAIDWDAIEIEEVCDVPSGVRYEMRIRPGPLVDDRGPENLELRVFRVGDIGTPPREVERLPARDAMDEIRIRLPQNQATGEVCFALAARDLSGSIGIASDRVCFHTIPLPFWDGCSVCVPRTTRSSSAAETMLGVAIAVSVARRSARRRRRGSPDARGAR